MSGNVWRINADVKQHVTKLVLHLPHLVAKSGALQALVLASANAPTMSADMDAEICAYPVDLVALVDKQLNQA